MKRFTNQSNGSQAGRMYNGGAIIRRFALFPLMLLMLLLLPAGMVAQTNYDNTSYKAYAEFNNSTGTLTFRYDTSKPEGAYDLNVGNNKPDWYSRNDKIKKVIFDASFANARPTSCYSWFRECHNLTHIEGMENLN